MLWRTPAQQKQIELGVRTVRKALQEVVYATDKQKEFEYAEKAQHLAFNLKSLIMHGGKWSDYEE